MRSRSHERKGHAPKRDQIRLFDFQILVQINKEVVSLTGDIHEYTSEDERKLRQLLSEVQETANTEERNESIIQKVSLLIFGLVSGQHFHEGNKRTALTAGESFLRANGYSIDISSKELVQVVDKASIGQAGLSEVIGIIRRLIRNVRGRTQVLGGYSTRDCRFQ